MSDRRFFVEPAAIVGETITITGGDAGHIGRVLRLGPGDRLSISDGVSRIYDADIVSVDRDRVICKSSHSRECGTRGFELVVFQGLPKGKKMEMIVEKLTEVGVDQIGPVAMARSVAEYAGDRGAKKLGRWRATALEAAKQSRRVTVPAVEDIAGWAAMVTEVRDVAAAGGVVLVPWEEADSVTVREAIVGHNSSSSRLVAKTPCSNSNNNVAIIIGPEGGFADTEIADLRGAGGIMVTLGPNILRTETAGIVAAALAIDALRGT